MSIDYALYRNKLTGESNLYAAKAIQNDSADIDDIIDRIVEQRSTIPRPLILAAIESLFNAVSQLLLEGKRVKFAGICEFSCRIKGKFNGPEDQFDPARHCVDLVTSPGRKMRDMIKQNARVSKIETSLPTPVLLEFEEFGDNKTNGFISCGNFGVLKGNKLSFNSGSDDEGIFFVNIDNKHQTKVRSVMKNKPSQLIFAIPEVDEGIYQIQICKRFTPNGQLRTGILADTVKVETEMAMAI